MIDLLDGPGRHLADETFASIEREITGRSRLEIEVMLAELVDMWARQELVDGRDPVELIATLHLARAAESHRLGGRVLAAVLPSLTGRGEVADLAVDVARTLDAEGCELPAALRGLGEHEFVGAAIADHELDDGHSILLGFTYPEGDADPGAPGSADSPGAPGYTVGVYIDHNLGTVVKDLLLGDDLATVEVTFDRHAEQGSAFGPIDPAEARARIEAAFARLDQLLEVPLATSFVSDDVADLRSFVEAHVVVLPPGGEVPRRPVDVVSGDVAAADIAVGEFEVSSERSELDERVDPDFADVVVDHFVAFAVSAGGDPMRVTPVSVEKYLSGPVGDPRVGFTADDVDDIVDVIEMWATWSLTARGLDRWIDETVDAAYAAAAMARSVLGVERGRSDVEKAQGLADLLLEAMGDAGGVERARVGEVISAIVTLADHDPEIWHRAAGYLTALAGALGDRLERGRPEIWAAGAIHLVADDVDPDKRIPVSELAAAIDASPAAISRRTAQLRELLLDDR